ncbi:MAG TPA: ABC transporter ATP-binding protein [Thermomicrobiales bacterium]|nr:ABC transporter ATP-binding protein [Thermomicrobiales bacterium]
MRHFRSFQRYWRLLRRYLRPQWPWMAVLAVILFASIGAQMAAPVVASRFIDLAVGGGALRDLIGLALLTMVLALAGQGLAITETYVAENVSWTATNALRADLLAHLLRLDAPFHAAHTPGELIERVDGDVGALARFFSEFVVNVVGNGVLILGVLALLFHVDWRIGLGLSAFVALALAVVLRIRAVSTPLWAAERQASADFYGFVGESLAAREDVRSAGAVGFVMRRCAEAMRSWLAATLAAQRRGYAMIATTEGLFGLGTAVALALSAIRFAEGALTLGAVYLVFQCAELLRQPTERIRNEVQELQQADAGIGRIDTLMRLKPRIVDGPGAALPPGPLSVQFDGVWFGYDDDAPVLRDINVDLPPTRVLGVVGRTGGGKTTLTRLLPRFYDPQAGVVRLGGVDLRSVRLAAVRDRIGVVSQDAPLFAASVRDNVSLFDDHVSDVQIVAALNALGLGEWLCALPRGLDTPLGSAGGGLSAGQAQILACARVFLRDPDVVILDEPSSRLDPATERLTHLAFGRLLEGRTGIVVAHRLATLSFADDILVLERGRAREHGPRLALAADPASRFAELLRMSHEKVAV